MNMRRFNCGLFSKWRGRTDKNEKKELLAPSNSDDESTTEQTTMEQPATSNPGAETLKYAMRFYPSGAPQEVQELEAIVGNFTYKELSEVMVAEEDQSRTILNLEEVHFGTINNQKAVMKVLKEQGYNIWEFAAAASALRQANHPNLLRVLGYCIETSRRYVVYEFMDLKSLDRLLFDLEKEPLSWNARMKIALGSAKGLEYLHKTMNPPVIHRNLKTKNVYVDDEFVPKLFDFGLPTRMPQWRDIQERPFGNDGWVAPEFLHLTLESDVYSFGILLLVILTGRNALNYKDRRYPSVADWARFMWNHDNMDLDSMVDSRIKQQYPKGIAHSYCRLALACINPNPSSRPDMSNVRGELESIASMSYDQTAGSSRTAEKRATSSSS